MASAKQKLKDYFIKNVGKDIDRETLREVAGEYTGLATCIKNFKTGDRS